MNASDKEKFASLSPADKSAVRAMLGGTSSCDSERSRGLDPEHVGAIYTEFRQSLMDVMEHSARRFIAQSLTQSSIDAMPDVMGGLGGQSLEGMMEAILRDLGLPPPDEIDDTVPGFVDRRGERALASHKQPGLLDQQQAGGEVSLAADSADYHAVPVGNGSKVNIVKNGDVYRKDIPADEAQRHIDELKAAEVAPRAVIGRAIKEVSGRDSRLKDPATRLELDSIESELVEVLGAMPPGERAARAESAIEQWLAERPTVSEQPSKDGEQKPPQSAGAPIDS